MTKSNHDGWPAHLLRAAEARGVDPTHAAYLAARGKISLTEINSLVNQALDYDTPPPDTVRRVRELVEAIELMDAAANSMLAEINPPAKPAE